MQISKCAMKVDKAVVDQGGRSGRVAVVEFAWRRVLDRPFLLSVGCRQAAKDVKLVSGVSIAKDHQFVCGRDASESGASKFLAPNKFGLRG